MKEFEIIDSKEITTNREVEQKYPNCCYLLINIKAEHSTYYGNLYAISHSDETYNRLIKLEDNFLAKGIEATVGGEYTLSAGTFEIINIGRASDE